LSRLFRDANFRQRLLEADSAAGIYQTIVEEDNKY
jgi:mannitol/fructose-specific phosphotransferase system IIA component (Ntr-type)